MSEKKKAVGLAQRANEAIKDSPYLGRRKLRCEAKDEGRIVLRGQVGTFFQKQMAQEALRNLQGLTQIDNHLEVVGNA